MGERRATTLSVNGADEYMQTDERLVLNLRILTADRYRRPVAVVILPDGSNLNQRIVRAGFGWWFQQYAPRDRELETLERLAREEQAGLWRDPQPIPPWEFRVGSR